MVETDIDRRLRQLERQTSRMRRWLFLIALAATSAALVQCTGRTDAARAKSFVVEDDEGRTRATLAFEDGGVRLRLFDASGVRKAALSIAADGSPGFALFHTGESPAAVLEVGSAGVTFDLQDANGKTLYHRP